MDLLIFLYTLQYIFYQLFLFTYSRIPNVKVRRTYTGGISILIPSYDEIYTIEDCINSIVYSQFQFDIEIIIIDDGKGSDTFNYLKRRIVLNDDLKEKELIKDKKIRNIYQGIYENYPIYIIDKENEGKSKALNCALKLAHYDYYVGIDGDTLIGVDSLQSLYSKINDTTLGIGGCVEPINSKGNIKERILIKYQIYEYLRSFYYARVSFNQLKCVPLLSGAISLYKKEVILKIGGYRSNTKGEDFDLSLRVQEYRKKYGGEILYDKDAVVYTQVPFDLKSLIRQRLRWNVGMLEVFKLHKKLFYQFDQLSIVLWIIRIYEEFSFLLELFCVLFDRKMLIYIISISSLYTLFITVYVDYHTKNIPLDLFVLIIFGYFFHMINNGIKVISYFQLNDKKWNKVKRKKIR